MCKNRGMKMDNAIEMKRGIAVVIAMLTAL